MGGGGVYVKWGIRGEREMEKRCKTEGEEEETETAPAQGSETVKQKTKLRCF